MSEKVSIEDKMEELAIKVIEDSMADGSTPADRLKALKFVTQYRIGVKKLKIKGGEIPDFGDDEDGEEESGFMPALRKKLETHNQGGNA